MTTQTEGKLANYTTSTNALKSLYENLNTVVNEANIMMNNFTINNSNTTSTATTSAVTTTISTSTSNNNNNNNSNAIYENVETLKQNYENIYNYYLNNNNSATANIPATTTTNESTRSQISLQQQALNDDDIKVQLYFCGTILVIYIQHEITLQRLKETIKKLCNFHQEQGFTIKWVDEEGDPCTISSQCELDEAIRLYYLNKESELIVHIFGNVPDRPGAQCSGEDRSIYRRGARRWRKLYLVNGHKYQAKRFARTALCEVCKDRIWGLGRQGYKCLDCKIMVHKRCHKFITLQCNEILEESHNKNTHLNLTNLTTPSSNSSVLSEPLILPTKKDDNKKTSSIRQPLQQQHVIDDLKNKIKTKYDEVELDQKQNNKLGVKVDASNVDSKKMSLDRFDLIKVIGRGSYAKVFLVEYKPNRKVYAMKVIKKTTVNDDEDIDWVQTEKHVFEQATNHPFLVGLHSCFQTESRLFFIIEYLCGGDLMYHMQQKRKLPEDHARFYSAEIIIALDFLHSKGIIYRDLKLDNVLLDMDGHIKLTDYGMCKEGILKGEKTSTFCGTPNYIAPEMLRGESYSFSVDWWALGVLMYEMMAGRSPFEPVNENPSENPDLHTEDHLFQVILEKPIRIPRNLSVRAASVLKAFLQKSPEDRLGTYDGLNEIKQHLFFKQLDWNALEQKQISPPYKPPVRDERDLSNIDKLFTNEPVILTPDSPNTLARIQQNEFEGFEYINPLIWSEEFDL